MKTDAELLLSYASTHAETDFAGFVGRRIGFVYHAALRQTGGDTQMAEDVTQAVFRLAARRAARLAQHAQLSGWLYTTATHLASRARRDASRRAKREQEAALMNEIENAGPAHDGPDKLRPLLDEALGALRKGERNAVLLRFFEGRGFAEIGAALKLSEDAARMRVARAVEKMRAAFAKRGVTSSAAALGALMTAEAAQAAPAGLAASVSAGAMTTAAAGAAATAGAILAFASSAKITTAAVVALLVAAGGAFYGVQGKHAASTALALARQENARLASQLRALEKQNAAVAKRDPVAAGQALLAEHPEIKEKLLAQEKAIGAKFAFRISHGMNLSPAQSAKVAEIMGRDGFRTTTSVPGYGTVTLGSLDRKNNFKDLRDFLGAEGHKKWVELSALNTAGSLITDNLSKALCFTDEPLTSQQARSLEKIALDLRVNRAAGIDTRVARWNSIVEQAGAVLSPGQMSALMAVGDEYVWRIESSNWQLAYRASSTTTTQPK